MKYNISVTVKGQINIMVEADSFEEAKSKAEAEVYYVDWNQMENVNTKAVNVENNEKM